MRRAWWMAVALVLGLGCGDDGGSSATDASTSTEDADVPAVGPCGVEFSHRGSGHPVVFHDSDGMPILTVLSDSQGRASYDECRPGTMITFADIVTPPRIVTFAGIGPNQTIRSPLPENEDPSSTLVVATPADTGALSGTIDNTYVGAGDDCRTSTSPGDGEGITIDPDCLGTTPADIDVFAYAVDSSDTVLGYSTLTGVVVDVGGGTAAGTTDPWVAAGPEQSVMLTMLPLEEPTVGHQAVYYRDGVPHYISPLAQLIPFVASMAVVDVFAAPSFFDSVYHYLGMDYGNAGGFDSTTRWVRVAAPGDSVAFDLSQGPVRVSTGSVSLPSAGRPRVDWIQSRAGAAGSAAVSMTIVWNANDAYWSLILPVDGTSTTVDFPVLPDDLADLRPQAPVELRRLDIVEYDWQTYSQIFDHPVRYSTSGIGRAFELGTVTLAAQPGNTRIGTVRTSP